MEAFCVHGRVTELSLFSRAVLTPLEELHVKKIKNKNIGIKLWREPPGAEIFFIV